MRLRPSPSDFGSMYSRCLVCRAPFPETGALENLPRGDRVAYDPGKGRLWQVCRSCRRWSLVPLESRWEPLEELEGLVSGGAKLLSRTDHIGLFRVRSVEVVRIGPAEVSEEAWWRFGRQLPDPGRVSRWAPPLYRRLRFGNLAWVGREECAGCGFEFTTLPYSDLSILIVDPGGDDPSDGGPGTVSLIRRCPRCKDPVQGGLRLQGVEAELTLARLMAFRNHLGTSRVTVEAAARLLEDPDGPSDLVRLLSRHGRPLGDLQPIGLTALEVVVSAARERTLMRLEAEALQARWRREEELARLVDGELSPISPMGAVLWRLRGKSGS
ncbi:MAG: hypothetical protein HKO65_01465 [Gemmatimonadetes bacterium]|nr:hypothetical protein [Gemmatimonadota bacterium]